MKLRLLWMVMVVMGLASTASAADLTADEIVSKANDAAYYAGADGSAKVEMTLSDGRSREFVILRKNIAGSKDQNFYVYFNAPADVRKMAYLVHKHPGGDDDRWLFLPALNLVKRIAPGDKRTSFVGSDFLYEDVSGRGIHEDTHELVETTDTHYVVNNVPKNPKGIEFSAYKVWIDKETFLPMKAEYLDKNGKLYRRVGAEGVQVIEGYPTATIQVAEDLVGGTKTEIKFGDIKFDVGLKDNIFTERFLRRPPREVTQ
ncbi:outer membrane lipoprotein-sorting protein [Thermodesulfobacteriota bacterium]